MRPPTPARRSVLLGLAGVALGGVATSCGDRGASGAAPSGSAAAGADGEPIRIAVIPKGTTHEFWKSVHAGAVKASRELKVEIVWKGPLKEDDLKQQIDLVQSFTGQGVSGIVLAPLDDKGLRGAVQAAARSKIPVVIFDSALQGDDQVSFVATDNVAAGKLAAEHMVKLLGGKGRVVVLRYQEGSASTEMREKGFLDAARAAGLEIVSDNQHGGATTESAMATSESLLLAQGAADGKVDGVFCPNESTTFGMLLALDKVGLAKKVKLVGFDASEKLVKALEEERVHGLVVQDPMQMGYLGVKTLVAHLRGEKVEKVIDTGARLVDRANMGEPAIKALLAPDLKEWLDR
jgi:ribose transport system substrate-binding protein